MNRVLVLIKGLGRGGAEQLLVNAARYSNGDFHYEFAYLLPHKNALVPDLEEAGYSVTCLNGRRGLGWLRRLRKLVSEREIDLVHAHLPYTAIGARLSLRGRRRPILVYTEHNVWDRYHKGTYWGNLLTFGLNDHTFAVSDHVRTSIRYPRWLRILPAPHVETLYHGADHEAMRVTVPAVDTRRSLGISPEAPVIGTVANFKPHKGYEYLIRAAARVVEEVPDARFVLVGVGPLEDEIKRQVAQLGLNEAVVFTGLRDDIANVDSTFDIFVLASIHEGLSIALVEAMALGKPAVVTSAGGVPEVVEHGRQGFIVPPRDAQALADHLVKLLQDPSLRSSLGDAARQRAATFDIRETVLRAENLYEELLS